MTMSPSTFRIIRINCTSLILVVVLVTSSLSIKWLSLSKTKFTWNQALQCYKSKKVFGLVSNQVKLCKRHLEVMPYLSVATITAEQACQSVFKSRRWNCTSIKLAPNFGPDLRKGTREQAYVYALSSAAIVHSVARACSSGGIYYCGCGNYPNEPPSGNFKWGGCADNIKYGLKFSKSFADSPWMRKKRIKGKKSIMNRHNNEVGRKIISYSLRKECKCHGVSGSCNIKTCWKSLPPLVDVGDKLMQRYQMATEVINRRVGARKKLMPANSRMGHMYGGDDLIYITKSPDYCVENKRVGSIGTRGRICNATSEDYDGCKSMCCGRGYTTHSIIKIERCQCKYYWCCYVKCKTCRKWVDQHRCK